MSVQTKSSPDKDYRFFLYDPEGDGFVYFKSEQERGDFSKASIQEYLVDGWDENVDRIVAGEITHTCEQFDRVDRPTDDLMDDEAYDEHGNCWDNDFTYMCNYKLMPLTNTVKPPEE